MYLKNRDVKFLKTGEISIEICRKDGYKKVIIFFIELVDKETR